MHLGWGGGKRRLGLAQVVEIDVYDRVFEAMEFSDLLVPRVRVS